MLPAEQVGKKYFDCFGPNTTDRLMLKVISKILFLVWELD